MKVVYSFLNVDYPEFVPADELRIAIVSALNSNKFYGNSAFVSNSKVIDKLKKLNLPFTDYEVLDIDIKKGSLPYVYKMYAYTKQTTDFINLDLDLLLNQPLPEVGTGDIKFVHRDHKIDWEMTQISGLYRSYFKPALFINEKYGLDLLRNLKLFSIPNMGAIVCKDPDLFREATNKALAVYFRDEEFFNSELLHGCFIEQGLIHKYLLELSENYKSQVEQDTTFLFDKSISIVIDESLSKYTVNDLYNNFAHPFASIEQATSSYDYKKLPAVHFLGSTKYSEVTQFFMIREIIDNLGIQVLEDIQNMFGTGIYDCYTKYKKLHL